MPIPRSYWVEPDRLRAGEHPAFSNALVMTALEALVSLGVDGFVDLTQKSDVDPYDPLLADERLAKGRSLEYRRMSIQDFGVPTHQHMVETLDVIDAMLAEGRVVYVHCLAGWGRTGTVVGCWLARGGLEGDAALRRLAQLREGHDVESPQTEEQRRFVRGWRVGD